jgi:hypothetical protein
MLIWKEPDAEITESDMSATSPTGQKGTEGHLLMRVIKLGLITSKASWCSSETDKEGTSASEERQDIMLEVFVQQPITLGRDNTSVRTHEDQFLSGPNLVS